VGHDFAPFLFPISLQTDQKPTIETKPLNWTAHHGLQKAGNRKFLFDEHKEMDFTGQQQNF